MRQALVESVDWGSIGCEVVAQAIDGVQGKEMVLSHHPDVVISDIKMPKCDGLQMIEEVAGEFPDIKFLLITGYQNFEYARRAVKLGVADILLKPVKNADLLTGVESILQKRLKQREDSELLNRLN
ncbi:MAG: response regulator, partial [Clostridia bacterium]|nr:response regulator [Clostridia bacterium]